MDLFGINMFGDPIRPATNSVLVDEFIEPPFSILNANNKRWNKRKNAWLSYGIKSEVGRKVSDTFHISKQAYIPERFNKHNTSVFDPVLCEIMYKWFCPAGGKILDPFAGGSVRGIIAGLLEHSYYGIELRPEQVDANREQAADICPDKDITWICGDTLDKIGAAPESDFIFTCPPYGNLEVYSDDPKDLSNMDYPEFITAYTTILSNTILKLRGEYAVIVVSNFRDKKGYYYNFVGDTISIFENNGMGLYNDIILTSATGTAAMRARKQFNSGKKVVKIHQNVLVFKKYTGGK